MLAFIISALFGAAEVFLLRALLGAMSAGNKKRAKGLFFVGFLSYGIAIALLMFPYIHLFTYCLCGFLTGFPLTAIALFIYKIFFEKEEE